MKKGIITSVLAALIVVSACSEESTKESKTIDRKISNETFFCDCMFKGQIGTLQEEEREKCIEHSDAVKGFDTTSVNLCVNNKLREHFSDQITILKKSQKKITSEENYLAAKKAYTDIADVLSKDVLNELFESEDIQNQFFLGNSWEGYKHRNLIVEDNVNLDDVSITSFIGVVGSNNVYISNPPVNEKLRTILTISVNEYEVESFLIKSADLEIDFNGIGIENGTPIEIKIKHRSDVKPIILNPEAASLVAQ